MDMLWVVISKYASFKESIFLGKKVKELCQEKRLLGIKLVMVYHY
ncbi:hypothetical protein Q0O96_15690 [Bacillus paranthracis]|nr:hypothetical protein [Bacillus paranthracis]MDN8630411.1 hypothetical protein [Bacillus paranthracis]